MVGAVLHRARGERLLAAHIHLQRGPRRAAAAWARLPAARLLLRDGGMVASGGAGPAVCVRGGRGARGGIVGTAAPVPAGRLLPRLPLQVRRDAAHRAPRAWSRPPPGPAVARGGRGGARRRPRPGPPRSVARHGQLRLVARDLRRALPAAHTPGDWRASLPGAAPAGGPGRAGDGGRGA